jgi:hypothetical protein
MQKLLLIVALLALSDAAFGQSLGTSQEAKAMLQKVVAAIKADRELALGQINKGENGFKVGDLYPFCARISDGKVISSPAIYAPLGTDGRTLKDGTGKAYGKEMNEEAAKRPEGEMFEVTYRAPKVGTTSPEFPKVSYLVKVSADLVCGVGYYK